MKSMLTGRSFTAREPAKIRERAWRGERKTAIGMDDPREIGRVYLSWEFAPET